MSLAEFGFVSLIPGGMSARHEWKDSNIPRGKTREEEQQEREDAARRAREEKEAKEAAEKAAAEAKAKAEAEEAERKRKEEEENKPWWHKYTTSSDWKMGETTPPPEDIVEDKFPKVFSMTSNLYTTGGHHTLVSSKPGGAEGPKPTKVEKIEEESWVERDKKRKMEEASKPSVEKEEVKSKPKTKEKAKESEGAERADINEAVKESTVKQNDTDKDNIKDNQQKGGGDADKTCKKRDIDKLSEKLLAKSKIRKLKNKKGNAKGATKGKENEDSKSSPMEEKPLEQKQAKAEGGNTSRKRHLQTADENLEKASKCEPESTKENDKEGQDDLNFLLCSSNFSFSNSLLPCLRMIVAFLTLLFLILFVACGVSLIINTKSARFNRTTNDG